MSDDLRLAPQAAFEEIDRLSRRHYRGQSAEQLLASVDTPLGRRQYARLLGVMLKEPFALEVERRPSESTRAVVAMRWKDYDDLAELAPGTWQFGVIRALTDAEANRPPMTEAEAISQLNHYVHESSLGKFVFEAFRKRICGDSAASKPLRDALAEAKKAGLNITTPTASSLSVGIAGTVSVAVAGLMPAAVVAVGAPVIGGVVLLLLQIGIDGFCAWSRQVIQEADQAEQAEHS